MASTAFDGPLLDGSNPEVARMRKIIGTTDSSEHAHGDGWSSCDPGPYRPMAPPSLSRDAAR